jgi:hypothetical protein
MKNLKFSFVALLAVLCGCASGQKFTVSPALGAAAVRLTVGVGGGMALNKNPRYILAARALADGIDVAISKTPTLTLENIDAWVATVCEKNNVPPEDVGLFVGLANAIYAGYTETFKTQVVSTADPNVLLYVNAFKAGISDAVIGAAIPRK